MSNADDPLFTASKAAKYLGISRQRVYQLAERLGGEQIGVDDGVWFFRKSKLDAFKAERESKIETVMPTPVVAV